MAGISGASNVSSLPDGYQVPDVWEEPHGLGGTFGSINRPTAGSRTVQELPRGTHDLQLYSLGTPNGIKNTQNISCQYFIKIAKKHCNECLF